MRDKYKTLICCCCGVLIFYSIIKLISSKSFEIVCENERFIYMGTRQISFNEIF